MVKTIKYRNQWTYKMTHWYKERNKMVILLDAMGGDKAPDANIKGAVKAINQIELQRQKIPNLFRYFYLRIKFLINLV